MFDLASIAHATDNFSSDKKLGEGGVGDLRGDVGAVTGRHGVFEA